MESMKKTLKLLVLFAFINCSILRADDCLEANQEESNALYATGECCEDSMFTATSASMVGWGVGLAAAIALLAGLLHQSSSAHD